MTEPLIDVTWDDTKARTNAVKHEVNFAEAATVILDPLALTVFDDAHSETEERWFTVGLANNGRLLAVSHTYQTMDANRTRIHLMALLQKLL